MRTVSATPAVLTLAYLVPVSVWWFAQMSLLLQASNPVLVPFSINVLQTLSIERNNDRHLATPGMAIVRNTWTRNGRSRDRTNRDPGSGSGHRPGYGWGRSIHAAIAPGCRGFALVAKLPGLSRCNTRLVITQRMAAMARPVNDLTDTAALGRFLSLVARRLWFIEWFESGRDALWRSGLMLLLLGPSCSQHSWLPAS